MNSGLHQKKARTWKVSGLGNMAHRETEPRKKENTGGLIRGLIGAIGDGLRRNKEKFPFGERKRLA